MYKEMYKCRLCGETYESVGTDSEKTAKRVANTRILNAMLSSIKPGLTETHVCKNGSFGIADFLGFLKECKEAEVKTDD